MVFLSAAIYRGALKLNLELSSSGKKTAIHLPLFAFSSSFFLCVRVVSSIGRNRQSIGCCHLTGKIVIYPLFPSLFSSLWGFFFLSAPIYRGDPALDRVLPSSGENPIIIIIIHPLFFSWASFGNFYSVGVEFQLASRGMDQETQSRESDDQTDRNAGETAGGARGWTRHRRQRTTGEAERAN